MDQQTTNNTTPEKISPQQHTELDFLYNRCDIPKYPLAHWISVPEFFNEVKRIESTGTRINKEVVFNIMREIYKEKQAEKDRGNKPDFNFYSTRKALRYLSKFLYGDADYWKR